MSVHTLTAHRRAGALVALVVGVLAVGGSLLAPSIASAQDASMTHPSGPVAHLTQDQRDCLSGQGLERPTDGQRPDAAQRDAFRAAADTCGIDLPELPEGAPAA